jgi:hypothetical protein
MIGIDVETIKIIYSVTGEIGGITLPFYLPSHEFSLAYRFGGGVESRK